MKKNKHTTSKQRVIEITCCLDYISGSKPNTTLIIDKFMDAIEEAESTCIITERDVALEDFLMEGSNDY